MAKTTFEDGREAQFQEMMQQLTQMQARYKGVRGELLAKVREEFSRLQPGAATAIEAAPAPKPSPMLKAPQPKPSPALIRVSPALQPATPSIRVAAFAADKMLPSCRTCGRGTRLNDADGGLICEKGHTRPPASAAVPQGESATH